MTQAAFVERNSASWQELEATIARARRGVARMEPERVEALGQLYRKCTSDLAYARGRGYDARLLQYLNRLTARAHAYVYGANAETGWARLRRFYTHTFPQEFRRSFLFIFIATMITVITSVTGYVVIMNHPNDAYSLLDSQMLSQDFTKSLHDSNFNFDTGESPLASSQIITNNIRVCMIAFAGAMTLGVLTVYILVENGLMLGGLGALFQHAGFGREFWITVAPHGVIELTAIQIAGAAGLLVVAGLLAPGRIRRRDAIGSNAKRAGVLFGGVASMLIVAGTIEGFYSNLRLPELPRAAMGAVTAVLLIWYFAMAGRPKAAAAKSTRAA